MLHGHRRRQIRGILNVRASVGREEDGGNGAWARDFVSRCCFSFIHSRFCTLLALFVPCTRFPVCHSPAVQTPYYTLSHSAHPYLFLSCAPHGPRTQDDSGLNVRTSPSSAAAAAALWSSRLRAVWFVALVACRRSVYVFNPYGARADARTHPGVRARSVEAASCARSACLKRVGCRPKCTCLRCSLPCSTTLQLRGGGRWTKIRVAQFTVQGLVHKQQ